MVGPWRKVALCEPISPYHMFAWYGFSLGAFYAHDQVSGQHWARTFWHSNLANGLGSNTHGYPACFAPANEWSKTVSPPFAPFCSLLWHNGP